MALLSPEDFNQRCQYIRLLVLDVDGVLTDGKITYTSDGAEIKNFSVKDGQGLSYWNQQAKRYSAIITARTSPIVERRATELGITHTYMGEKKKLERLTQLVTELNLDWQHVAYMGDDWPDAQCLQQVGLATCPNDAANDIQRLVHWQSQHNGGSGAVRELIEHLLRAQFLLPNLTP